MEGRVQDTNCFELFGRIVNYFETDAVYIITVETVEPHKNREGRNRIGTKPRINFPKVYFFKIDPNDAGSVFRDDMVSITGHVVATAKRNRFGRNYVSQALIGESIKRIDPATDKTFYVKNRVWLEGPVISVEQRGEGSLFAIKMSARNKHFDNFITVITFNKDALTLEPGTVIRVKGRGASRVKEGADGNKRYYQNIEAITFEKTGEIKETTKPSGSGGDASGRKASAYDLLDEDGKIKGTDDYIFEEIDPSEVNPPEDS